MILMKALLIFVALTALTFSGLVSAAEQRCEPARVQARAEVAPGEFSLADLLVPGACPAFLREAARISLGRAPLAGSVRVLEGSALLALVDQAESQGRGTMPLRVTDLPQRIVIRRAGARASCRDLKQSLLAALSSPGLRLPSPSGASRSAMQISFPEDAACGGEGRIRQAAPVEVAHVNLDPARGDWEIVARCLHPADCVPFLVRLGNHSREMPGLRSVRFLKGMAGRESDPATVMARFVPGHRGQLVRPGETITLAWDQDGIRLVVPAICFADAKLELDCLILHVAQAALCSNLRIKKAVMIRLDICKKPNVRFLMIVGPLGRSVPRSRQYYL